MLGLPFTLDPDLSAYYATGAPYNFSGYSNPKVDELFAQGKAEADVAKRQDIYSEVSSILQQDLPIIHLYALTSPGVVSNKVVNAKPTDFGMFYNIHEWDLTE